MARWKRTGTGPGRIVGHGNVEFHARPDDNAIRTFALDWDGDSNLVPFLPGVAFDQYFPNLRVTVQGQQELRGNAAQVHALNEFEAWVSRAKIAYSVHDADMTFKALPMADVHPDEEVAATASFVVRLNEDKRRLWSETSYSSEKAEELLFSVMYQVIWNWVVESATVETRETMIAALERQFEHYGSHGIPSDILMRGIGKAPFSAWQAISDSSPATPAPEDGDIVAELLDRAVILCAVPANEQTTASVTAGPTMILDAAVWGHLSEDTKAFAGSLCWMGFALRLAEQELIADACDPDDPRWISVAEVSIEMVRRYADADDGAIPSIAAAAFYATDRATIAELFQAIPGLSAQHRELTLDRWLAGVAEKGLTPSRTGVTEQDRLFAYGYALAVVREFQLVAQGRGDEERQDRLSSL
ncbi:MAG TPA: hypothetical protein VN892_16695 [Solirubrobacteraceae bacterium]|nr:hypothetical protein [Solirubrobacteraceae bacterium]